MALEREALTHKIEDDLALRNRNWDKLDSHLAESATQANLGHVKLPENWISATLQNGWTGTLKYRKDAFGKIEVTGVLMTVGTTTPSTEIASLPSGYRPPQILGVPVNKGNVPPYNVEFLFSITSGGSFRVNQGVTLPATGTTNAYLMFYLTYSV